MHSSLRSLATILGTLGLLGVAACNGSAVVTLTATPSSDTYLTYRVGLASLKLETSNGKTTTEVLANPTTVDLTQLLDVSEVVSAAGLVKGNYTTAVLTLDYGAAKIVYDDGSLAGLALSPVDASGTALSSVQLTIALDPSAQISVGANKTSRLALDFKLAASNVVNVTAQTVTVRPMVVASAAALDEKPVRVHGPLAAVDAANLSFTSGIMPFNFPVAGSGTLPVVVTTASTFEINGVPYLGTAGLAELAAIGTGSRRRCLRYAHVEHGHHHHHVIIRHGNDVHEFVCHVFRDAGAGRQQCRRRWQRLRDRRRVGAQRQYVDR